MRFSVHTPGLAHKLPPKKPQFQRRKALKKLVSFSRLVRGTGVISATHGVRAPQGALFLFHAAAGTAPSAPAASQGFHHSSKPRSRAMTPALM
jgi:hypothetical protein